VADLADVALGLLERHGLRELHFQDRDLVVRGRGVLPRLDKALPGIVAVELPHCQPAPQERLRAAQLALMSPP